MVTQKGMWRPVDKWPHWGSGCSYTRKRCEGISLVHLNVSRSQSMATHCSTFAWKIPWTEEPGRLQSMGSLESDTTERLHFHFSLSCIGEGNSNPLQCSCLENPRDGEAWWAAIYGVAQSRTQLKRLISSSSSSSSSRSQSEEARSGTCGRKQSHHTGAPDQPSGELTSHLQGCWGSRKMQSWSLQHSSWSSSRIRGSDAKRIWSDCSEVLSAVYMFDLAKVDAVKTAVKLGCGWVVTVFDREASSC